MIRDLRLEALEKEPRAFKGSLKQEIKLTDADWQNRIINSCVPNAHEFFIIAKYEGKVVGIVGASKKEENNWVLKEVYVRAGYRKQGIGTTLLEAMMWKLDHLYGAKKIELIVNTKQDAAIDLYKKCGFIVAGTLENQESGDGNVYTKFVMYRNVCTIESKMTQPWSQIFGLN